MKKAIVILLVLGACGGSSEGWSEQARTDYIAGCEDSGGSHDTCVCVQEKLEAAHPDLKSPEDIDQTELTGFIKDCA